MGISKTAGAAIAAVGTVLVPFLAIPLLGLAATGGTAANAARTGIPPRVAAAYHAVDGWCSGLRWQLVAAIGSVESAHGASGGANVNDDGTVSPPIFGPSLDGRPGVMRLPIEKWIGWFGLPGPWQQAVGPMQFLPSTFSAWAVDADGDGVTNPHDIDDAAATAANYLCQGPNGAVTDERVAVLRYNHDDHYADRVLAYAAQLDATGDIAILCPVAGPTRFTNTWLAARPGGRQHQGVDLFAAEGTAVVAPVAGIVELAVNSLGGLVYKLWGDDGNHYYGAHLAAWADVDGHVDAGTVVGYVGRTGNAETTPPHLHFEIHLGRQPGEPASPVDPTHVVAVACR